MVESRPFLIRRPPFGEAIRKSPDGKSYWGFFYVAGVQRRYTLGKAVFFEYSPQGRRHNQRRITAELEVAWLKKREQLLEKYLPDIKGVVAIPIPQRKEKGLRWDDAGKEWIEDCFGKQLAKSSISSYKVTLRLSSRFFKNPYLSTVKKRDILKFQAELGKSSVSIATINRHLVAIRVFLNWAHSEGKISEVPEIKKLKQKKQVTRTLTPEQISTFITYLEKQEKKAPPRSKRTFQNHKFLFVLILSTGIRLGTALSLRWADFSPEEKTILARVGKTGEQLLHLPPVLLKLFRERKKEYPYHTYLLDTGSGEMAYKSRTTITHAFRAYFRELGFPEEVKPLHGLRAFFATSMGADVGGAPEVISSMLSHTSYATTAKHYISGNEKEQRRLVEQYNSKVLRKIYRKK